MYDTFSITYQYHLVSPSQHSTAELLGSILFANSFTLKIMGIISKNASNKSYSELNFPQKTQWAHFSISPRNGARELQRFTFLISYNALECK